MHAICCVHSAASILCACCTVVSVKWGVCQAPCPVCTAGWVLVDAACTAYSMTSVPLYDTLGPEAVTYICGHAELTVVACSVDVLDTLLTALPQCPTVKIVVCTSMLHLPTAPQSRSPLQCWQHNVLTLSMASDTWHLFAQITCWAQLCCSAHQDLHACMQLPVVSAACH